MFSMWLIIEGLNYHIGHILMTTPHSSVGEEKVSYVQESPIHEKFKDRKLN